MKYFKSTYAPVIIQFLLGAFIVLFLVFYVNRSAPKNTLLTPPKKKDVEARMEPVQNAIHFHQQKADDLRPVIADLSLQYDSLVKLLSITKSKKDTVQIIRYQEVIIDQRSKEVDKLNELVGELDSVNNGLRYIVGAKDTLLALQDLKLKKVKRQRNMSMIINGALGGFIILK